MPGRILHGRARNRGQRTHKTSVFGIMGGTINSGNYRNSIRSATQKATNYNIIPPRPDDGYNYMLNNNLLSKNPQCSGGVGRMHTHPGACGPCNCTNSLVSTSSNNTSLGAQQNKENICPICLYDTRYEGDSLVSGTFGYYCSAMPSNCTNYDIDATVASCRLSQCKKNCNAYNDFINNQGDWSKMSLSAQYDYVLTKCKTTGDSLAIYN